MANGPLQVVGVLLTLICFILTFIAACLPYWRSNDIEGEVIETIRRSSGLWTKCTFIRFVRFFARGLSGWQKLDKDKWFGTESYR